MSTTSINNTIERTVVIRQIAMNCKYQSKRCLQPRALKKNGKYHSLCEEHRAKANSNQRKLDRKKRKEHPVDSFHTRATKRFLQRKSIATTPHEVARFPFPTAASHLTTAVPINEKLNMEDFNFLVDCFGQEQNFGLPSYRQMTERNTAPQAKPTSTWQSFLHDDEWRQPQGGNNMTQKQPFAIQY